MNIKTYHGLDHLRTHQYCKPIEYIETNTGCWECTSHKARADYPMIIINGYITSISRHICIEKHGNMKGLSARHKCDNPAYINPDHLEIGTHEDNMRDMVNRGRSGNKKGINHSMVKLTEKQVLEIRQNTNSSTTELAIKYNITESHIRNIKSRRAWKHLL
jgi:hypothetical protein